MITRLDNPSKPNKELGVAYNNKGSVARLKNYLVKDESKFDASDMFFTAKENNIPAETFYKMIDNNVKGLEKDEHKFYSFTINPSSDELKFIGNDKEKLKEFTRFAMQDFKGTHKTLKDTDNLVWGAIIHQNRLYTKDDLLTAKKSGGEANFKIGDIKPGANSHIHIVLSARDAEQKKTITVFTKQNKLSRNFQLMNFQQNNQKKFQELFYYKNGVNIYAQGQVKILEQKIEKLNKKFYSTYNINELINAGNKTNWSTQFNKNLYSMLQETYRGQKILQPEVYLEKGKKFYDENTINGRVQLHKIQYSPIVQRTSNYNPMLENFSRSLEQEGEKQATKGTDLVKAPKRKRKPGFRRSL